MKTFVLLSIFAASAFAQTTIPIPSITVPTAVAGDLERYRLTLSKGTTALTGAINASATTLVIVNNGGAVANLAVGNQLMIDQEPMTITALSPLTVTRSATALPSGAAAAHADGATVQILQYATVVGMLRAGVLAQIQTAVKTLGSNSAYLAALLAAQQTDIQNTQAAVTAAAQ